MRSKSPKRRMVSVNKMDLDACRARSGYHVIKRHMRKGKSVSPSCRKSRVSKKSPRLCHKLGKDNCKDVAACRWVVSHVKKGLKHKSKVLSHCKKARVAKSPSRSRRMSR